MYDRSIWFSRQLFIQSTSHLAGLLLRTQSSAVLSVKSTGWAGLEKVQAAILWFLTGYDWPRALNILTMLQAPFLGGNSFEWPHPKQVYIANHNNSTAKLLFHLFHSGLSISTQTTMISKLCSMCFSKLPQETDWILPTLSMRHNVHMGLSPSWTWCPNWLVSEWAGILGPRRQSACCICQSPVPLLQDECCWFRLSLSAENTLLVPHHTGDPCRHKRDEQETCHRAPKTEECYIRTKACIYFSVILQVNQISKLQYLLSVPDTFLLSRTGLNLMVYLCT